MIVRSSRQHAKANVTQIGPKPLPKAVLIPKPCSKPGKPSIVISSNSKIKQISPPPQKKLNIRKESIPQLKIDMSNIVTPKIQHSAKPSFDISKSHLGSEQDKNKPKTAACSKQGSAKKSENSSMMSVNKNSNISYLDLCINSTMDQQINLQSPSANIHASKCLLGPTNCPFNKSFSNDPILSPHPAIQRTASISFLPKDSLIPTPIKIVF